ncbi:DoxX family membrane protein [Candidatus Nomurabacteria bacterium]|nr:DoxX family membrane protein [Candidatus Nomurabacteria bacterium]
MDIIFIIGRVILGGILLISGINHFTTMEKTIAYAQSKKVPMPGLAVSFTGLMLLFSGLVIILWGLLPMLIIPALIMLAIFLFFTTLLMHAFWKAPAESKMIEMRYFMSNTMLFGATLIVLSML